jgi:hypothetical protein
MTSLPSLIIKPLARQHGLFVFVLGVSLFLINLLLAQFFWQVFKLVLMLLLLVALLLMLFGVVKLLEPKASFMLTPKALTFYHKYGHWQLAWHNIRYLNVVTSQAGLQTLALPYLGITLYNINDLIDHISPRLASRLIHEQRPLLVYCISQKLLSTEQSSINFSPYKAAGIKTVSGPIAAFLHHSLALHQALGFHLFLPNNALDREISQFVTLLQQCQRSARNY